MANKIVILANEFLFRKSADIDKCSVTVGDDALGVRFGNQNTVFRKVYFMLCNWFIYLHDISRLKIKILRICFQTII